MEYAQLGWDAWVTLMTLIVIVGMLIFSRMSPDVILLAGLTFLLSVGVLNPDEALMGFSNEGMITVGVLYIVVTGLRETGGVGEIVYRLLGRPRSLAHAQIRLMAPVVGMSAFLNNTPVVAMLIPAVVDWGRKFKLSVSHLMIPLSYAAILGGTCTLIGTSTNLVVNGMLLDHPNLRSLGMFEIGLVGFPSALIGLAYVLLFSRWLLPERIPVMSKLDDPREYTVEMIVEPTSPLVGKTIEQAGLRNLPGMFLVEIERENHIIPAVPPQEKLHANDRLVFVGIVESVIDLQKIRGLTPATNQVFKLDSPRSDRILIETVVSNSAPMVGKSIRDVKFRTMYNAVVIAVARNGVRIKKKIGDIVLRPGDTLLLEAHPSFFDRQRNSRDFFLVSCIENSNPLRHEKAWLAMFILVAMILLVTFNVLSMLKAAMIAAGLMILTKCSSANSARQSIDLQVLLVIAASFGIGYALEKTGAAAFIAQNLISLAGDNPRVLLAVVYFVTMIFTEMITNNAAAVLIFPIALATAQHQNLNVIPFAIAIMMAASASFSTPIGYQTNLMVLGPGGYRFTDYFRIGIPLNLLMAFSSIIIIPFFWPLQG
jgi:di/tricarboxylate transporter